MNEATTQDHAFSVLETMHRYNQWIVDHVAPWTGRRLLEVGAGTGNLTSYFTDREEVLALDLDPAFAQVLRDRLGHLPNIRVLVADATAPLDPIVGQTFDSILCVNVLEHIPEEATALRRFHEHLTPGGTLLLLVPAHPWLYGEVDRLAGHCRRYRRRELGERLRENGFEVVKIRYFNMLGALGWWVNVRLLRRRLLPELQMGLLNRLVPLLRLEDRISPPFGLSLIAVARRT